MNEIKSISINDIYEISLAAHLYDKTNGLNSFKNSILNLIYTKKNNSEYYSILDYIANVTKSDVEQHYQLILINHILTDTLPMVTYSSSKPLETYDLFQTLNNLNNVDINESIEILENKLLNINLNI